MNKAAWINVQVSRLNGNIEVIDFISKILYFSQDDSCRNMKYNSTRTEDEVSNPIASLFTNGFCYYFAVILKDAFNRGEICWHKNYSHIVWRDVDGTSYDIDGVFDAPDEEIVPVETSLSNMILDFKHTKEKYTVKLPEFHDWIVNEMKSNDSHMVSTLFKEIPDDEIIPNLTVEENVTLYWLKYMV